MRLFATPKITSKYSQVLPNAGGNVQNRKHTHIFSSLSTVENVLGPVQEKATNVFHLKKQLQPSNIVLDTIPLETEREGDKCLYTITGIAALKQITRNWLDIKSPSIGN